MIGLKGKKQIGALSAAERGCLITVVTCFNANGDYVPPMLIFPRKKENKVLLQVDVFLSSIQVAGFRLIYFSNGSNISSTSQLQQQPIQ